MNMAEKLSEGKSPSSIEAPAPGSPPIDPALLPEHQHHHTHQHHTVFAEQGREDEVVYSKDTTFEKGIVPEPTPLDHGSPRGSSGDRDEETGGSEPATRPWYLRIRKHWRHFAHAVIWLLFTG